MYSSFCGRKQILDLVRKRVADLKEGYRQNMCLLGSQHIGKSAVLQRFLLDLDDHALVAVYLDLESRDLDYMISKTIRSLMYQFLKYKGNAFTEDFSLLVETARGILPLTASMADSIKAAMSQGRRLEAFDALIRLPEVFSQETGLFCMMVYDEFQQLDEFDIPDVFKRLAARITTQKQCLYILTSSFEARAKKILAERLTLLFGSFEVIDVGPLDLKGAHEFISCRLGEIRMGLQLRNFLSDFTGGKPLYLDLMTAELINLSAIYKQPEIYAPLVVQSIENLVFNRWGALSRHFELMVSRLCTGKTIHLTTNLLMSLANGRHKMTEFITDLGCGKSHLVQRLAFLIDEDIVEKNGTFFCIKDKMFRYWLKYVLQRRLKAINMEPGRERKELKEEANRAISDFQISVRQDLPSRLIEVLGHFENDQLSLYGRKYKIPSFRDMTALKMRHHGGSSFDIISAGTDEGLWLLVLRKDPLSETDINTVMDEAKKMGMKPRRCVIVSLSELDAGTRLKALEEQMWIWNERELNALMNLFDKPCVMP